MSGKSIVIEQKLLLLGYEVNRSVLLAENEKIRTILAKLEKFFFFQAEDGIRDGHVNGVQTCALPIFLILLMSACQPAQRCKCENHCDRVEVPRVVRQMAPLQRHRHREKQQGGGD